METNKKLLVIHPSEGVDCLFNILVAETGEHLASHFCSHSGYAYGDLYSTRKERIKEWTERFGELEVKFLNETNIKFDELLKRNEKWYNENKVN